MYTIDGRIRLSETDHKGKATLPAIVNYFQDCSAFQSEDIGLGVEYLETHKKAWVLNAWQIVVEEYPHLGTKIRTGTWASGFEGLYGTRNFLMCDESGKKLAYANSIWVFMDLRKGRPARPAEEDIAPYGVEAPLEMEYAPRKIPLPEEYGSCRKEITVAGSDIDTNEHMNNCIYIRIALDVLPQDTAFHQVRVEYRRSAVLGDVIVPWVMEEEDRILIRLCDNEKKLFAIVEFQK